MKKSLLTLGLVIALISTIFYGCTMNNSLPKPETNGSENNDKNSIEPIEKHIEYKLGLKKIDNDQMVALEEISKHFPLDYTYDSFEGILKINSQGHIYKLMKDTTILSEDGIYQPNNDRPFIDENNHIYLPVPILDYLHIPYKQTQDDFVVAFEQDNTSNDEGNKSLESFENEFPRLNKDDIVYYLSFLSLPLEAAHITTRDTQMPGAPRTYRNGTHEGIDWYSDYTGIKVTKNTPVLSMADGTVVRADWGYKEMNAQERKDILDLASSLEHTPQYILDKLRGRTIWVQYENGVLVRYAHLSSIKDGIEIGKKVKTGDILGYVGNSGTSDGVKGNNIGVHLHSDIIIYDHLFWEYLNNKEIREVLEKIF